VLVLSRKPQESIKIKLDDGRMIDITIIDIRGDKCRIGITAPEEIPVHRSETWDKIMRDGPRSN